MKTRIFILIASLVILPFTSCQKDTSSVEQAGINIADDDAVSGEIFEDIFSTADNASLMLDDLIKGVDSKTVTIESDSCPFITITHPEDGVWPKLITVDFGEGCEGFYNSTRSGKILIEITAPRLETGSVRTITLENYKFNGILVEGTKVIENMGPNDNQNVVFNVTLTGGRLTLPDGRYIERTASHQREWTAGLLTRNIWDDECLVTGSATGTTIEGAGYTNTILTALRWQRTCFFIVSGVLKIEREGKQDVTLDYGNGGCDAKAVVTVGGESQEIILRHKHRSMAG